MDEEADAGDHRQHRQRQAVEAERNGYLEITHRHPVPQRLGIHRRTVAAGVEKIQRHPEGGQCRQPDAADADRRGKVFRPAAAGKRQQQEPRQGEN